MNRLIFMCGTLSVMIISLAISGCAPTPKTGNGKETVVDMKLLPQSPQVIPSANPPAPQEDFDQEVPGAIQS